MRDNLRQIAAAAKMVLPQAGRRFVPKTKITPPRLSRKNVRDVNGRRLFHFIILYDLLSCALTVL